MTKIASPPSGERTPEEFRRRREALGLSQARLALAIGAHRLTVIAWEVGRRDIPDYAWIALWALEHGYLDAEDA